MKAIILPRAKGVVEELNKITEVEVWENNAGDVEYRVELIPDTDEYEKIKNVLSDIWEDVKDFDYVIFF